MKKIRIDYELSKGYVNQDELKALMPKITLVGESLDNKTCLGNDFIGWLDLPKRIKKSELDEFNDIAKKVRSNSTAFITIGIGGSYLGTRAGMEFIKPLINKDEKLKFYYAGHNLCGDYLEELLKDLKNDSITINVISKSGTTTESAVVFRVIKEYLSKRYSKNELKERIICTTDQSKGALLNIARQEGYKTFVIPDDIGGRFSVLTPVGLLPLAIGGVDIVELVDGAKSAMAYCSKNDYNENPAYLYAGIRHILNSKGKDIEILSNFHPAFLFIAEWWKQLFGESEGKDGKGIFPASCNFTTDLHSIGQLIQDGKRNLFETFLILESQKSNIAIPRMDDDGDGLNYLAGKNVEYVNDKAYLGTRMAHFDGGTPNLSIIVPDRSENSLGQLFYFFEKAVSISGLLSNVNPFNQPGVEAYKKNMFKLLGKK